ncbi:MAG: hypothetical protein ACLP0J_17375 [Solirubrobacteraceae bacterium]|jgi:chemotaxis protein histidine kinase CheA
MADNSDPAVTAAEVAARPPDTDGAPPAGAGATAEPAADAAGSKAEPAADATSPKAATRARAKPAATKAASAKSAAAKSTAKAKSTAAKAAPKKAAAAEGASKASEAKSTEKDRAILDRRLELLADRLRKLNERIIEAGREAGEATLSSYEKALKAIASGIEKGPGSSEIDWLAQVATAQAKFIRDLTDTWTKAARGRLK